MKPFIVNYLRFIEKLCCLSLIFLSTGETSYIRSAMMTMNAPKLVDDLVLKNVLDTELGTIQFYDNLIVMEAKEDVVISLKTGMFILLKVISIVGTKPVVYISNRVNSYAVVPTDYKYLEMIPNLRGIAVVSYSPYTKESVELESRFFNKPFTVFDNMNDAKNWSRELLNL